MQRIWPIGPRLIELYALSHFFLFELRRSRSQREAGAGNSGFERGFFRFLGLVFLREETLSEGQDPAVRAGVGGGGGGFEGDWFVSEGKRLARDLVFVRGEIGLEGVEDSGFHCSSEGNGLH